MESTTGARREEPLARYREPVKGKQDQVLDAAIRVLGTRGTRALTHRAVDAEAGIPVGSTSNYFRTREALLSGLLGRLSELETASWREFAEGLDAAAMADTGRFAEAVGGLAGELAGPSKVFTLARHAVFLEAAVHDGLRQQIVLRRAELESWGTRWMRALGSSRPSTDFWTVMALLDGLLIHQTTAPDPAFAPAPAIAALLRGLQASSPE
ncbi:TetR family transcriptional regulator [Saccharomonospora sp. NPDC006951]